MDSDATTEPVVLAGDRDVRGTLDLAGVDDDLAGGDSADDGASPRSDTVVVACPPHPQYGGSRSDPRLRAVADRLTDRGVDCLRFDYGPWAEGVGERADLRAALAWATDRYAQVAVFGYSFGGAVAILVAAERAQSGDETSQSVEVDALCALSPARSLADGGDVPAAVPKVTAPAGLVYGTRDDTVDWEPTVAAARRAGWRVTKLTADHQFTGRSGEAADAVVETLEELGIG
jgi:alpha/beta superfamily hydrolase